MPHITTTRIHTYYQTAGAGPRLLYISGAARDLAPSPPSSTISSAGRSSVVESGHRILSARFTKDPVARERRAGSDPAAQRQSNPRRH